MAIHIMERDVQKPTAWSLGLCESCGVHSPIRIDSIIRLKSINGVITIGRKTIGERAYCDFCERSINTSPPAQRVPRAEWLPQAGIESLARQLHVTPPSISGQVERDRRLRSLLESIEESISLGKVGGEVGAAVGMIFGGSIGALIGYLALRNTQLGSEFPQRDTIGLIASMFVGAGAGVITSGLIAKRSFAPKKLLAKHDAYNLDIQRLEVLANDFSPRIQDAVVRLRDRASLTRSTHDFL